MCPPMRAHWRHLANTIEPFVCGGDAALCQITLTTCFSHSRAETVKDIRVMLAMFYRARRVLPDIENNYRDLQTTLEAR